MCSVIEKDQAANPQKKKAKVKITSPWTEKFSLVVDKRGRIQGWQSFYKELESRKQELEKFNKMLVQK